MARFVIATEVTYDDGTEVRVEVGQRDIAAWERSPQYVKDRPTLMTRWCAFSALRRSGQLPKNTTGGPVSFETWDAQVDSVIDVSDDGAPDEVPTTGQPPA